MTEPSEVWAAGLLLVVCAIASGVAGQSRRLALDARRAADQAQALQFLTQMIIDNRARSEVIETSAAVLARIFGAPAIIFSQTEGQLRAEATAGGAVASRSEIEAATAALKVRMHFWGKTYPNDDSRFDFWPITPSSAQPYVLAVDFESSIYGRPSDPERLIDVIGAYLAPRPL